MIPFSQLPKAEQDFLLQVKHATFRPTYGPGQLDYSPGEEVTLKLSRPVLERLRATGTGWESRVEQVLRDWLDKQPEQLLDRQKAS